MKLFKSKIINKNSLAKIQGGSSEGHSTTNCYGTTYTGGYGIGTRSDQHKRGDWYPSSC